MDRFLDGFLAMGIPGYDCMVMYKGEEVYRRYNGFSDKGAQIYMNGKERYHIFSCSKPITCAAALQLWEKGLYQLDDPLEKYMPEFADMSVRTENGIVPARNKITIRQLFTMTAGFDYNTQCKEICQAYDATNGACPTREVMKYFARYPLSFEPGEKWQYSLCHDVLAAFVEVVSGEKFEEYVKKHIFEPLGMKNSTFLLPRSEQGSIAPLYRQPSDATGVVIRLDNNNAFYHSYRLGASYASGGAGGVSSVEDYMLFLEAMRKGDVILKNATIDMMTTPQLTPEQNVTFWNNENYYYGLGVRCPMEGRSTDSGWGGAAGAFLAFDRINDLTLYYAQSVLNSPNAAQRREVLTYAREALGLK